MGSPIGRKGAPFPMSKARGAHGQDEPVTTDASGLMAARAGGGGRMAWLKESVPAAVARRRHAH
jgi:hypothetical protein